ncbi:hypothetical protein [Streptomyces sp. NPDC005827]|uniref:hypothetical protein n=1 Tax=Streptomyces sp. NPDC005827 TaxID=3157070 RepID=UPI0033D32FB3
MHGTVIGGATSTDGRDRCYLGALGSILVEPGTRTSRTPEIVCAPAGVFHMYVSCVTAEPDRREGHDRRTVRRTGRTRSPTSAREVVTG